MLQKLCRLLNSQIADDDQSIGIICECDDGEMTTGAKRNKLLSLATADYICFIDDDDLVSDNYIASIKNALITKPDCVGIEGTITFDGQHPAKFIHSKRYSSWFEQNGIYYRTPNHLNPIKRETALKVGFPDQRHGEDSTYSSGIFPLLETEVYIEGPIYLYNFRRNK